MKQLLFILLFLPLLSNAQITRPNSSDVDSATFTFMSGDGLFKHIQGWLAPAIAEIDTSGGAPWQVGGTLKPFFSNTVTPSTGIMTDLIHPYQKNTNASFILKLFPTIPNFIIDIWHEYLTDSTHAGGILEFSNDSGTTWLNVAGCSYFDTAGMYTTAQTLTTGDAAFTGNSQGQVLTRIQVINCVGLRRTATTCMPPENVSLDAFFLRFRFVSDTTTDSLPGWKINSIMVENPGCFPTAVAEVDAQSGIWLYPNPATDELTISSTTSINSIEIMDVVGKLVYKQQEVNSSESKLNIANLPPGVYFTKVNDVVVGKFVKE